MKRYRIPTYLIKRKIELLRQKIISRKYGYLFYRKTVSKILPSEARRYHRKFLMRTHFEIWYHLSVGWKRRLRAQVHYNLKITHSYFKKWQQFYAWRKCEAMKRRIAIVHYENNWRRLEARWCLQKWKIFNANKRYKKGRLKFAWDYFKKKHPYLLRPYFHRWVALVIVSRKAKQKMQIGTRFYESRLLGKHLKVLFNYRAMNKQKKQKLSVAINFCQKKLLSFYFKRWKLYCSQLDKDKMNFLLAQTCYSFKIQKFYLKKLLIYAVRQKFLRQVYKALDRLLLKNCLQAWIKFTYVKQVEKNQVQFVTNFAESKMKKAALGKLTLYVHYRRRKLLINLEILRHAREHLRKCKLIFYLQKWKFLVHDNKIEAAKLDLAAKCCTLHIKKLALHHWKSYTNYKRYRKGFLSLAVNHYNSALLKFGLRQIKEHLAARQAFKKRIGEAKQFYKTSMIEEAIRVIMLIGIQKQQTRFQANISRISRELFIAQKYLDIWKSKTIYKALIKKKDEIDDGFCDIGQDFCPNPDWFQMCFMLPRVYNSDLTSLN